VSLSSEIVSRTQRLYDGVGGDIWTVSHRQPLLWALLGFLPWGSNMSAAERFVDRSSSEWETGTVLDVPIGMGRMFPAYANRLRPKRVIAVDLAPGQLRRAQRSARRSGFAGETRFIAADVVSLPLPDASVNSILTEGGFHHFPDRAAAMRELMRVLVPGGHIAGYGLVAGETRRGDWCLRASYRTKIVARPITADEMRSIILEAGVSDWCEFRTGSMLCFSGRKAPTPSSPAESERSTERSAPTVVPNLSA
jgi:SAM-dependent methyltransferase